MDGGSSSSHLPPLHFPNDDDEDDTTDVPASSTTVRSRAKSVNVEIFSVKDPPKKRAKTTAAAAARGRGGSAEKSEVQRARMATLPSAPLDIPTSILDSRQVTDTDESYSENERALSNFLKLHPMLRYACVGLEPCFIPVNVSSAVVRSLDATNEKVLSTASNLLSEFDIPAQELEITNKRHDDLFLRRAEHGIAERDCALGERCICKWLSVFRHGENARQAFTCREFLLPSQHAAFLETGKLPKIQGKCLVCCRYFTHYVYNMARNSATFNPSSAVHLQAFGSKIGVPVGCTTFTACETGTDDGYLPSAMLFIDEAWADSQSSRSEIGSLLWRPTVRFCSRDYQFVLDQATKQYVIIQVGIGMKEGEDQLFVRPVVSEEPEQRAAHD